MQLQPWNRWQCDQRLRTDMEATCQLLDATDRQSCLMTASALYWRTTAKIHSKTAASFCSQCSEIVPTGNPKIAVDLSGF